MIKAILFDADGVVLNHAKIIFSEKLKADYGIEIPLSFWKEVYPKTRVGKASLEVELEKKVKEWGWQKSVKKLLGYWWGPQNTINNSVLELVKKLRKQGIKCYLASDNNRYRADDLMKNILGQYFDGGFFSCYLSCVKEDDEYYQAVLKELKLKPKEILFVDDEEENVKAARKMGLRAVFYRQFSDLEKAIHD